MSSKPILIVALAVGAWSVPVTGQPANSLPILEARLEEARIERVETHLQHIESIRAIKRLQSAYGHYVELGLWNDFADLFTEDALTNYQQGARGKDQIRKLFFDQVGQGKLGLADGRIYPHILFQPVITLAPNGRTAKGRWRILAMLGGLGGSATWYSGVYENEYVLEKGVWKISVLRSEPKVTAAYTATGWKDSGTHVPFHYTAAGVTSSLPDSLLPSSAAADFSLTSLAGRVTQLAQRGARLTDQAEVTNVLDAYGYAFERKLWNQVADLFSRDGTLELGLQGVYVGKASIRHGLDQFGPQGLRDGERNDHVYLQTVVTIAADGRTAKARGVELIFSSDAAGELREGVFEDSFVKQGNAWKIQSVHFYPRMIVDAAVGWAKSSKPAPGPSKAFPPDRPPTSSYEIYPTFAVAPFHFDNPVTGKSPQYPAGVASMLQSTRTVAATPGAPRIRNAKDLDARLSEVERSVNAAEAYDAAENLLGAYGYYLDESPGDVANLFVRGSASARPLAREGTSFVNQVLQPVIEVAANGKSAKVRARTLDLGGISGGAGYWSSGTLYGEIVLAQGAWKFQKAGSTSGWSAPYPGGWARKP